MSFRAATTASVDSPANQPELTGASPSTWPSITPAAMPMTILAASSTPPRRTTVGSEALALVAPMQT